MSPFHLLFQIPSAFFLITQEEWKPFIMERKEFLEDRHACICNTIIRPVGRNMLTCFLQSQKRNFPWSYSSQVGILLSSVPLLLPIPSDPGLFTLCATQNCQCIIREEDSPANHLISPSVYKTALAQHPWNWATEKYDLACVRWCSRFLSVKTSVFISPALHWS